jgi:hypothetical protein
MAIAAKLSVSMLGIGVLEREHCTELLGAVIV